VRCFYASDFSRPQYLHPHPYVSRRPAQRSSPPLRRRGPIEPHRWRLLFKYSGAEGAPEAADLIAEALDPKAEAVRRLLEMTGHLEVTDIDYLPY
jgi:hypothetical protein